MIVSRHPEEKKQFMYISGYVRAMLWAQCNLSYDLSQKIKNGRQKKNLGAIETCGTSKSNNLSRNKYSRNRSKWHVTSGIILSNQVQLLHRWWNASAEILPALSLISISAHFPYIPQQDTTGVKRPLWRYHVRATFVWGAWCHVRLTRTSPCSVEHHHQAFCSFYPLFSKNFIF